MRLQIPPSLTGGCSFANLLFKIYVDLIQRFENYDTQVQTLQVKTELLA
jgi:hypothetical protein